MARESFGAVAVDLGASSARFAVGRLKGGKLHMEVIRQIPHDAKPIDGVLRWNLDRLLGLCVEAGEYADAHFDRATLAIDAWGVDHGFLGTDGKLLAPPVCYRDPSHVGAFERLATHRPRLYALTGIQHQPFNTICQLEARRTEDPSLPERGEMLLFPDLLGYLLTGERHCEFTEASTTQLMGLDGRWSAEAFEIAGWPVPELQPSLPGTLGGKVNGRTTLARVGSHDTASALFGFGSTDGSTMAVNIGTWSLAMVPRAEPIATPEAEAALLTNERSVDGKVRLTKNIPGFWVLNRLHEDLKVPASIPEWLASAEPVPEETLDLFHPDLFSPPSMLEACQALSHRPPETAEGWAALGLASLAQAIASQVEAYRAVTGVSPARIRLGGGGSRSESLRRQIAERAGVPVEIGPAEATVLGNLAVQMVAAKQLESLEHAARVLDRSN